jgi:3',5'-cyclic AMP phosphodiesterase CpdA
MPLRLLHVSDLHFGRHSVAAQVEGVERLIATENVEAIVVTGDLSQRTRRREFERARKFLDDSALRAPVLVVPGNHDTAWWTAPLGFGSLLAMHARYRRYISEELEPVLHIPGATIVGLNSAQGIRSFTLTARPRDLSVVGALRKEQWAKAKRTFDAAPKGDLKVLVFHHNLRRGHISRRWGLANRARSIESAAETGADVVLCGHDHEARVESLKVNGRQLVVSCASTLTTRVRGGGPGSINAIEGDEKTIQVNVLEWREERGEFERVVWLRSARDGGRGGDE